MSIKRVLLLLLIFILIIFLGLWFFFKKELVIIYEQITGRKNIQLAPSFRVRVNEVHSPDGEKKLLVTTTGKEGEIPNHLFLTSDISGANKKTVFEIQAPKEDVWISPNAWSPDNKYFYILKKENGMINALVFKATGDPFLDGSAYLNMLPVFNKSSTGYIIVDITGWDSPTLLHVSTAKDTDKRGPSFWFDVDSKVFLQLSG